MAKTLGKYNYYIEASKTFSEGQVPKRAYLITDSATELPADYADLTSIENWDSYGQYFSDAQTLRNIFVNDFLSSWTSLTEDQKGILIKNFVWPISETAFNLDNICNPNEREKFKMNVVFQHRALGCLITKSTTTDSSKYINWTANDNEVANPKIITTDKIIE